MRKRIIYLLFVCILCQQGIVAQKIYNTWFFGYHSGLDFNTDPPTPLKNDSIEGLNPPYYTTSICDANGKLLFFTDGFKVRNASKKELVKLSGRWPWSAKDEIIPLFCPYPDNDSLYYLFTVGKGPGLNSGNLLFLTIKKYPNANNGEIVYPQPSTNFNYFTVLANNSAFMLAGTAHCNQKDTWIATVSNGSIKSFLISSAGVTSTPVISSLAVSQAALGSGYSNMKFSANGEKLIIPVVSRNEIIVYDFNNQTGVFSNPVTLHLPSPELLLDIEISPAATKLYYGSYINEMDGITPTGVELHNIFQLDLEAGSVTDIENSRYRMNAFPDRGGCPYRCYIIRRTLQLGPDGRIYISLRDFGGVPLDKTVNVIEYPDRDRENASYRRNYIDLGNVYKFINVSYIRSGSFSAKENGIQVKKKVCFGLPADFSLLFTKIDSVKWNFGDPSSGNNNYSSAFNPSHNYNAVGLYTVSAIIYKSCTIDTATTQISIDPDPIVQIPAYIKDTIVCTGTTLYLDAASPAASGYQWNDGLIYSYREIDKPGTFRVMAYNACSSDQKTFTVEFKNCPCDVFIPSAFTPNNDGLNDVFKPVTRCFVKDYQFTIYSRYGNIVFRTKDPGKGWTGIYQNIISSTGVYTWTVQYINPNTKEVIKKSGTVTLIR